LLTRKCLIISQNVYFFINTAVFFNYWLTVNLPLNFVFLFISAVSVLLA
jgi:hypothetical protein